MCQFFFPHYLRNRIFLIEKNNKRSLGCPKDRDVIKKNENIKANTVCDMYRRMSCSIFCHVLVSLFILISSSLAFYFSVHVAIAIHSAKNYLKDCIEMLKTKFSKGKLKLKFIIQIRRIVSPLTRVFH